MRECDVLIIGGGPAGLASAREAVKAGCSTVVLDDAMELGGQLVKQTHKFFGSEMEYAGVRGIWIAEKLLDGIAGSPLFTPYLRTTASGLYEDGVVTALFEDREVLKFRPKKLIIATGAMEKTIPFPGNDLPGVYGAGAVQTLMNVYGVMPGKRCLMVGAGNIGLIVSYQLLQAGVEVSAVIEGMDRVGGYWVHASKIARLGIPILTRTTILKALGEEFVTGALIADIDENWQPIAGTEREVDCDFICLAVGLLPLVELFYLAECEMKYVHKLGGDVPLRDATMRTTNPNVYVAGDSGGIEEASSAMVEGAIAGLCSAKSLGAAIPDFDERFARLSDELAELRCGPVGEHIRRGLAECTMEELL
ncbi:MAG TPA: FAD-dependent oxidoreductase [candidate division Zixibacteria bacterium]|nr:FAD-dependent oxidoreductase [candidate division Zixibacteria bacterium]